MIIAFLVGALTGVISGFGIGGGSLLILYLTAVAGINQFNASGINLLYFICCAPLALISHIKNKLIVFKAVLVCSISGVICSIFGALLASHIDTALLHRLFGFLLLYVGAKELFHKKKDNTDH